MTYSTSVPSNAPSIQIPAVGFCVVSPLIVAIRFWSRLRNSATLGMDDWVILLSLIFGTVCNGVLITACSYGYGKHGADLTPYNKRHALMYFVLSQIFYKCSINLTKASIILLYLRLFVQKPFRFVCCALLGFIVAFGIATTLTSTFQCNPVRRAWNKALPGTCLNTTIFWYTNAGFSILGDIIILILPMPVIYSLKLRLNQKLSLMFVFALGFFVIVTSVLRMTTLNTTSKSPDPTWEVGATMWTIIEPNTAIICACLPMCRMPLQRIFPKFFPGTEPTRPSKNTFSHAGSGKNDWTPSRQERSRNRNALASTTAGGKAGSEEYILHDRPTVMERDEQGLRPVIQKTTQFSVQYDDAPSIKLGEQTSGKMQPKFEFVP